MKQPTYAEIADFCNSLHEEKDYFNITFERIIRSEWIISEYMDNNLVAIAGIEKKYGIVRSWTVVKKGYWGKGIGSKLISKRFKKCREDKACHLILGIVDERNIRSIQSLNKRGYKYVGQKENLLYYAQPVSVLAPVMIYFLRAVFPMFRFVDKFRT